MSEGEWKSVGCMKQRWLAAVLGGCGRALEVDCEGVACASWRERERVEKINTQPSEWLVAEERQLQPCAALHIGLYQVLQLSTAGEGRWLM